MRTKLTPLAALLFLSAGCSPPGEAVWLSGAGYGWQGTNHRLSYLDIGIDTEQGAWAGIIGGTSTSGQRRDALPDECEPSTCREFPVLDNSDVDLHWTEVRQKKMVFGAGGVSVTADHVGATTSLAIDLERPSNGIPVAVISGLQIDTDEPLADGPECYNPGNGWLPTHIGIELGTPVLSSDDSQVLVDVTAWFEAGLTHEDERECVDEVVERARVPITVSVLAMVTKRDTETIEVAHGMVYDYNDDQANPPEQPPPDPSTRTLGSTLDGDLAAGWSRLDWTFHDDETDGRGAYIRTLEFHVDPANDFASGHATNYSPGTQFSGFDYDFVGTVEVVDIGQDLTTGIIDATLPAELDETGRPVVHALDR